MAAEVVQFELDRGVGRFGIDPDAGVFSRAGVDSDVAIDGERQHQPFVVVLMASNEIHSPRRNRQDFWPAAEPLRECGPIAVYRKHDFPMVIVR